MKPPKSWLSDYSKTLGQAKKDGAIPSAKSFGRDTDDSFRHYMARKIDLQRQQFGLVLPPDPKKRKMDDAVRVMDDEGIIDVGGAPATATSRNEVASEGFMNMSQGISSVLSRLKEKHKGCGSRQKLSQLKMKKNRRKNRAMGVDRGGVQQEEKKQSCGEDISQESTVVIKCSTNHQDNSTRYQTTASSPQNSILEFKRQRKDLFLLGVVVLVNGYTDPCADTIMRMMHKHGGDLEKYETARVTHIIAETLSTAKAKIYKRQRNPIPVVKPMWIVDCVNAGKLIPHADYLLDQVRNENVGVTVKSFFPKQPCNSFSSSGNEDADLFKQQAIATEDIKEHHDDGDDDDQDVDLHSIDTESSPIKNQDKYTKSPNFVAVPLMTQLLEIDDCDFQKEEQITPKKVISKLNVNPEENHVASKSSPWIVDSDQPLNKVTESSSSPKKIALSARTVGTDPNFLESYFKSSRLSFIGSFKQRIEKSHQCRRVAARSANAKRYVFHVDMDCFFAAVALTKYPQYKDKPVAVGHAWKSDPNGVGTNGSPRARSDDKKKSYSELSTCNYKAREYGVKKGMFLHRARELCPDLIVLPYDYDEYEDASNKVGDILYSYIDEHHGAIEQVSCDESYLEFYFEDEVSVARGNDIPYSVDHIETVERLRSIGDQIRKQILDETGCTASIGIGKNKLLAKLATNHVKEKGGNGFYIVDDWKCFLKGIHLRTLPGVGYKMNQKLQDHGLTQVCDIWDLSEGELSRIIGPRTACKLYKYCYGNDDRLVKPAERKTIGAECNYGVRFDGPYGVDHMILGLAKEVEKRMNNVGVLGRHITLKVKVRQVGAGQPGKFNGHGMCDDHSKSCKIPVNSATRDSTIIANSAMKLYSDMDLDKNDIRGMGIVISNLEVEKYENGPNAISSWLRYGDVINYSKTSDDDSTNEHIKEPSPNEAITDETYTGIPSNYKASVITTPSTFSTRYSTKSSGPKKSNAQRPVKGSNGASTNYEVKSKNKASVHKIGQAVRRFDGRYRQYDVKCMLNLASIKSGAKKLSLHGEEVSLTQLDALPLELQLQVANNNCDELSMPPASSPRKKMCHNKKVIQVEYSEDSYPANEPSSQSISSVISKYDTFQDVLVLSRWMDDHSIPAKSQIQKVLDYFNICIVEKRLEITVKFLRLIRNRSDAWGEQYERFLNAVDTEIKKKGKRLDITGLGL